MKRRLRARLFSVLWDLGDWAMRHALELDDSEHCIDWKFEAEAHGTEGAWDPWLGQSTNSANCTTTRVTRFQ